MPSPRILCIGEALIDVVHRGGEVSEHVGGSLLNVANALGAAGLDSTLACWIGDDARGQAIEAELAAHGVALAPLSRSASATPVAEAHVDSAGHATYTFDIEWDVPDISSLGADHLHTGSLGAVLAPGAAKVREAMERHAAIGTVSFDPNARPAIMGEGAAAREHMEQLMALADIVKASDEDMAWLYPDIAGTDALVDHLLSLGPSLAIITGGGEGAAAGLRSGARAQVAPCDVPLADTVGAGDAFMAGLLAGLADGALIGTDGAKQRLASASLDALMPALARAAATAGLAVSHHGAYAPTRAEVDAFLEGGDEEGKL